MILKMRSVHGWVIVPDIGFIEYSNAESKRMGFYEIEAPGFMNFKFLKKYSSRYKITIE